MIGPWTHGSPGLLGAWMREGLAFLCEQMPHGAAATAHPADGPAPCGCTWPTRGGASLPDWPPPGRPAEVFLQPDGGLGAEPGRR